MVAHVIPCKKTGRQQMINKSAACDKVGEPEAADGEDGAAAEPEQQPARRAHRDIESDRERDRYEIVLDEPGDRHEQGRTQKAEPIRRFGNVTDEAAEHYRLAQSLRIVDRDPGGRDKITKTQGTASAEDRIDSVTVNPAYYRRNQDAYRHEGHKRDDPPAQQQVVGNEINAKHRQK